MSTATVPGSPPAARAPGVGPRPAGRRSSRGVPGPAGRRPLIALLPLASAALLIPWTALLAVTLPGSYRAANWNTAWAGFDVALTLALAAAGLAAWRRHRLAQPLAVLAATLLGCDAWFDVTTASSATDLAVALTRALLLEVPLAAVLLATSTTPATCGAVAPAPSAGPGPRQQP